MAPRPKIKDGAASLDHDELIRKRDAFVTSMAMLRNAADEASRTALAYFDVVTSGSSGVNGADHALATIRAMSVPPALHGADDHDEPVEGKRKRKRTVKPKDPNAPKKPATPFLLFCQTGRETVKKDLGPKASYAEVQEELRRRWDTETDKNAWSELYQQKLSDWKVEKADYDTTKLASETGILPAPAPAPAPAAAAAAADPSSPAQPRVASGFTAVNHNAPAAAAAADDEEAGEEGEEEEEEVAEADAAEVEAGSSSDSSLTPPPKEKPKPVAKPRKVKTTPIKLPEPEAPAPEKKKRGPRAKKNKEVEAAAQLEAEAAEAETPKKRGRKRRKSGTE